MDSCLYDRNGDTVEPSSTPKPRMGEAALSPVCEPLGLPSQAKHHLDQEQLFSETALEAATNY
jgi:hypothetical protein